MCSSDLVSLEVAAQYLSPVWTGPAVTVNGVALPTDGTGVMIDLAFDASCTASLQVVYQDAGEIGVNLSFVGSGDLNGLTILGGDSPVFYPAALVAQAATAGGTLLDAVAAGTGPVHAAGEDFALTVSAVNAAGVVTRGYRPQAADRLRAYVQRTGPMAGYEGVLNISAGGSVGTLPSVPSGPGDYVSSGVQPGDFVDGVYAYPAASYSEVGLLTLYLLDSDYLGHAIAASPLPVGRFVPAGFQASGSVLNRFATAGCAGGSFTYMGEGLRLGAQLTALNRMGVVTRNYQGSFAAFDGSGFGAFAGAAGNTVGVLAAGTDLSGRLVLNGVALSVPWAAGTATLDIDLALQAGPAPDGPYDATVLGLAFSDADGVALQGLDTDVDVDGAMDHLGLGSTGFRYGRLSVGNAHGSELRDLAVPIAMQYFAGSGLVFTTHTVDNCTPIAATLLSDADPGDALLVSDTCIVDQFAASGANACPPGTPGTQYSATAVAGQFSASLKAPGPGKTGGLRVNVDVPTWAQFDWSGTGSGDPSGIATFGIYNRSTDFIYQRELR